MMNQGGMMQKLLEARQAIRQVEVQSKDPETQKADELQKAKKASDSEDSDSDSESEGESKGEDSSHSS